MRTMRLMKFWMMKLMGMPSCEGIERFAYDYLEERLDSKLAKKFEGHLRGCDNCHRFVQTYREVTRPDRLLRKIPLDPDFERRIAQFLKKNK